MRLPWDFTNKDQTQYDIVVWGAMYRSDPQDPNTTVIVGSNSRNTYIEAAPDIFTTRTLSSSIGYGATAGVAGAYRHDAAGVIRRRQGNFTIDDESKVATTP